MPKVTPPTSWSWWNQQRKLLRPGGAIEQLNWTIEYADGGFGTGDCIIIGTEPPRGGLNTARSLVGKDNPK